MNRELDNLLSIELKGNDISKELITFSLPKSLKGTSSYINESINLGSKNSIYFNYSIPNDDLSADLKAKILVNESKLALNEDSIIDLTGLMIEADINNAGATYHRGPVVVDSNIVSSPHYDFMGEWMRTGYEVLEQRGK